jgi:hypothetical protein
MTAPGQGRPLPTDERSRDRAERLLGPQVAKRIATFKDGVVYVQAREWLQFLAWLVDFVVFWLCGAVGFVIVAVVGRVADLDIETTTQGALVALLLTPLVYGAFYGNGRALGAVLTGIQLVRIADGGRIGGKAPWAMVVRTILFPLLLIFVIFSALAGNSSMPGGGAARVSVDVEAIRRLRDAGIW